nr:immunoglobulin heavy chain junction region [Macaca mulatta]
CVRRVIPYYFDYW